MIEPCAGAQIGGGFSQGLHPQLTAFYLFALYLSQVRGTTFGARDYISELTLVPGS